MCPSKTTDGSARGYIIPIGGAEEKFDNPEILDRFVEICGGSLTISLVITRKRGCLRGFRLGIRERTEGRHRAVRFGEAQRQPRLGAAGYERDAWFVSSPERFSGPRDFVMSQDTRGGNVLRAAAVRTGRAESGHRKGT